MNVDLYQLLAMAPAPTGNPAEQPPFWIQFIPFVFIFIIFYFVLIRPQVKRQKEQQALLNDLKNGDKVIISGGIHGTIAGIQDKIITVKIAENVKIDVEKESITTRVAK
jgi:preprotein translocase subunit YajC